MSNGSDVTVFPSVSGTLTVADAALYIALNIARDLSDAPAARRALDNAVSIAASLLNTEAIVADDEVDETDELDYQPTVGTGIGEDAAKYAW